jgi:hypothetical protein
MVGVFRLLALLVDHDLSAVTSNDETLGVGNDALNVKVLPGGLGQEHLVVALTLKQHDLSAVCAHDQSTIWHPSVASEEVGDVSFLLGDLSVGLLE